MHEKRWVKVAAGVAVALVVGWGCGSGGSGSSGNGDGAREGVGSDTAQIATVAIGQPLVLADGGAKAAVVVSAVDVKARSKDGMDKPERGQFVTIQVEITATSGASDVGPSNFRFVGSDGTVFKSEIIAIGFDAQLDAMTEIQEGQKKSGKVVFDCDPKLIAGGKIELSDDGGSPAGYWSVPA